MKFTLQRKHIRAALHFAAKKDVRYYLNGICVTQNFRGTVVESTNGHVLGLIRVDIHSQDENRIIIGRDDCEKLIGTKKQANEELHFTITKKADGVAGHNISCEIPSQGLVMHFAAVDAVFPDTDRVVPKYNPSEPQIAASYNPEYIKAFSDAAAELMGAKSIPVIYQRGNDAALVSIGLNEFVGVVMPMRDSHSVFEYSAWIHFPRTNLPVAA
jgi:DNA polymerase-3 subunit beta